MNRAVFLDVDGVLVEHYMAADIFTALHKAGLFSSEAFYRGLLLEKKYLRGE